MTGSLCFQIFRPSADGRHLMRFQSGTFLFNSVKGAIIIGTDGLQPYAFPRDLNGKEPGGHVG